MIIIENCHVSGVRGALRASPYPQRREAPRAADDVFMGGSWPYIRSGRRFSKMVKFEIYRLWRGDEY